MTLVIAFGNPFRQDDGVGWVVADALQAEPGVEVRAVHQLLPELAEPISHAEFVIFVDACCDGTPGEVRRTPVVPVASVWSGSHALDPGSLLGLCRRYYGHTPEAVLVTVAGSCFGFGDQLSQAVRRAIPRAVHSVLAGPAETRAKANDRTGP